MSRDLWALVALLAVVMLSYLPVISFVAQQIDRLARIVGGAT
jgi:hypothetical protein